MEQIAKANIVILAQMFVQNRSITKSIEFAQDIFVGIKFIGILLL